MLSFSARLVFVCGALFAGVSVEAKPPTGPREPLTVEQIIQTSLLTYDKALSYQGTLTITEKFPKRNSTVKMTMRVDNGADGLIKCSTITIKGSTGMEVRMLDDGKLQYAVNVPKKEYRVSSHRPDRISGLLRESLNRTLQLKSALTVSEGKLGNARVYVISGKPKNNPVKLLVNASNFQVESLQVNRMQGKEAVTMRIALSEQKFNAPIPASVFAWKAPAGYKKR